MLYEHFFRFGVSQFFFFFDFMNYIYPFVMIKICTVMNSLYTPLLYNQVIRCLHNRIVQSFFHPSNGCRQGRLTHPYPSAGVTFVVIGSAYENASKTSGVIS